MDIGLESAVRGHVAVDRGGRPRWTVVRTCRGCGKKLGTIETANPPVEADRHGLCGPCFMREWIDLSWDLWDVNQAIRKQVEIEMAWQQYYEGGDYREAKKCAAGE